MATETIVTAIVSALSAGAAETGKKVVGDAYEGLKSMIKRRFGEESEAVRALEKVEAKPNSDARRHLLQEELDSMDAGADAEIVAAAQALIAVIKSLSQGEKLVQTAQIARGSGIAQASGQGASASVTYAGGMKKDG